MESYKVLRWKEAEAPTAEALRGLMERDGYRVFHWSDAPGTVYGEHYHSEAQSHCVVSGEIELELRGAGKVILRPGDRDQMPAGTYHAARVLGDEPVVYLIGVKN
jgi:quercetin dioxygenase-like cupin family protein